MSLHEQHISEITDDVLQEILESIMATSGQDISTLTDEEVDAYLEQFLRVHNVALAATDVATWFEKQVARQPNAIALITDTEQLSYHELNCRANSIAHQLITQGIETGSVVGICAERSMLMIVGILGILKAGAAYVPFDPAYPPERLALMIKSTATSLILAQDNVVSLLSASDVLILPLHQHWDDATAAEQHNDENVQRDIPVESLAYIIFTSGSTREPRGVMVTHANIYHYVHALPVALQMQEHDVYLHTASFSFSSSVRQLLLPFAQGSTILLAEKKHIQNPVALFELIKRHKATVVDLVPSYWKNSLDVLALLAETERKSLLDNAVRLMVSASEPLPWNVLTQWMNWMPSTTRFSNMFGQTETSGIVLTYTPSHSDGQPSGRIVPIGQAIGSTRAYVVDHLMQPVPPGFTGELMIGGLDLARGYLNYPALTAEKFVPDPFSSIPGSRMYRTGDIVRQRPGGELEFVGREDYQVKISGVRIDTNEIEAACLRHEHIHDALVTVREKPSHEKALVAFLIAERDSVVHGSQMRQFLKAILPNAMIPAAFVFLEAFPLTFNGKLDLRALPTPQQWQDEYSEHGRPPTTPLELNMAEIWSQILHITHVSLDDNFFELGGDSMLAMQVVARARKAGIALAPGHLFSSNTLAELVEVAVSGTETLPEQQAIMGSLPLTPSQRWFFEEIAPTLATPQHFNHPYLLALRRPIDPSVIRDALQLLVTHHDALRLHFAYEPLVGWQQWLADDSSSLAFQIVDVSTTPEETQASRIITTAISLQSSLDLTHGPLLRAVYFKTDDSYPPHLLLIVHHLLVDGFSKTILLEDLQSICEQLCAGKQPQLPAKTTPYSYWAEHLKQMAQREDIQHTLDNWLATHTPVEPIPVDHPDKQYLFRDDTAQVLRLSQEETQHLLQKTTLQEDLSLQDVLIAAISIATADWTQQKAVSLALSTHGRAYSLPDIELSRTVGWFQRYYPIILHIPDGLALVDMFAPLIEQIHHEQRHEFHYALLRYVSSDSALRQRIASHVQPQIDFNYQPNSAIDHDPQAAFFEEIKEPLGGEQDPDGRWPYQLHISAGIVSEQLQIKFRYGKEVFQHGTLSKLVQTLKHVLTTFTD